MLNIMILENYPIFYAFGLTLFRFYHLNNPAVITALLVPILYILLPETITVCATLWITYMCTYYVQKGFFFILRKIVSFIEHDFHQVTAAHIVFISLEL